jgi:flagellar biosynthesis/type III secretory pathway protein FliH
MEHEIMVPYLQEHGSDIMSILVHEYSFEDELRIAKEEAAERSLERGLAQGIEEGMLRGISQGIEKGRAEGRADGIEEGREAANMENARRMKADGVDAALIAKYTGLAKSDIAKL